MMKTHMPTQEFMPIRSVLDGIQDEEARTELERRVAAATLCDRDVRFESRLIREARELARYSFD